jgi:hypothetical protein
MRVGGLRGAGRATDLFRAPLPDLLVRAHLLLGQQASEHPRGFVVRRQTPGQKVFSRRVRFFLPPLSFSSISSTERHSMNV